MLGYIFNSFMLGYMFNMYKEGEILQNYGNITYSLPVEIANVRL